MGRLEERAERQETFLRVLAETGSEVKARRAAGVVGRTVRLWQEEEAFLDAFNDALAVARDAVVQKSRELALSGVESQLGLWMKLAHVELRPSSSVQVAVVNGGASARVARLSDDELLERARQISRDHELRQEGPYAPAGDVIDVDPLPTPLPSPEDVL